AVQEALVPGEREDVGYLAPAAGQARARLHGEHFVARLVHGFRDGLVDPRRPAEHPEGRWVGGCGAAVVEAQQRLEGVGQLFFLPPYLREALRRDAQQPLQGHRGGDRLEAFQVVDGRVQEAGVHETRRLPGLRGGHLALAQGAFVECRTRRAEFTRPVLGVRRRCHLTVASWLRIPDWAIR